MNNRIVLCLDGTWNSTFQQVEREDGTQVLKPTNPLKLSRAILPVDPATGKRQITYYDSGVGAIGLYPGATNKLLNFVDSKLGGAWGAGFEANIEQAANFLCINHEPGDDVFIFGFSRGAAQARGLTRFLGWLGGIPPKTDAYYIPLFFRHYLETKGEGNAQDVRSSTGDNPAERIRPLAVRFLGVWDTVMALGSRFKARDDATSDASRSFHTTSQPAGIVNHAWQALAIDEKRYDFRPEIWTSAGANQTLKQRWFAGAHGNVGGSYGNDGLANIALHWIVAGAVEQGLAVDGKFLRFYRPFSRDQLSDSHSLLYKTTELLRFRRNRGVRSLEGYPATANLTLDASVIERICADPADYRDMDEAYRPANVVAYLKQYKHSLKTYLLSIGVDLKKHKLPDDVRRQI